MPWPQQLNHVVSCRYLVGLSKLIRGTFRRTCCNRAASTMTAWQPGRTGRNTRPIERPSDFQNPQAPPLDVAPSYAQVAAWAPKNRPAFDSPEGAVAPLSTFTPEREEPRDPQEPFAVVTSTMTSDSAWGAVHWAPQTGQPTAAPTGGWLDATAECSAPRQNNPWPSTPGPAQRRVTSRRPERLTGLAQGHTGNSRDRPLPSQPGPSSTPSLRAFACA